MSRPLKIALVTTFYPPYNFGGDGIYVRRLAHLLVAQGLEVSVIFDKDAYRVLAPKDRADPAPLDGPDGLWVHGLSQGAFAALSVVLTQQLGRPVMNGKALTVLLNEDFDIIHFHNVSLVGGPSILSMGNPSAIRLYTAHEHWLVCPTHVLWRYNRELCQTKACVSCQLSYKRPPQMWRGLGVIEHHAKSIDAFIALSHSSAQNHARFGFSQPMHVLPSFLPDLHKGPVGPHPNGGRPYLLFAGRLEVIKGLSDVIEQFDDDMPCDLLIAGSGDYGASLKALARSYPKVRFLGQMTPEGLNDLYQHATAVLTPSICYEVFPLVALEAFRARRPIIARQVGAYPEIVAASGAGALFSRPEEIKSIIKAWLADQGVLVQLRDKARTAFDSLWSQTASLAPYFKLIEDLAIKRQRPDISEAARALYLRLGSDEALVNQEMVQ